MHDEVMRDETASVNQNEDSQDFNKKEDYSKQKPLQSKSDKGTISKNRGKSTKKRTKKKDKKDKKRKQKKNKLKRGKSRSGPAEDYQGDNEEKECSTNSEDGHYRDRGDIASDAS